MTKRAVITGLGIVSCLGNDAQSVTRSLHEARSGIKLSQEQVDVGMRSHISGAPEIDLASLIDRKQYRFMADAAGFAYIAGHPGMVRVVTPVRGQVEGESGSSMANPIDPSCSPSTIDSTTPRTIAAAADRYRGPAGYGAVVRRQGHAPALGQGEVGLVG